MFYSSEKIKYFIMEHVSNSPHSDNLDLKINANSFVKEDFLQYPFIDQPLNHCLSNSLRKNNDEDCFDWYNESPI